MNGYRNEDLNQLKESVQTINNQLKSNCFQQYDKLCQDFKNQYNSVAACDNVADQLGQLNQKIKNMNDDILEIQKELVGMLNSPGSIQT